MLGLLKKLFGVKDTPVAEAPYKVELPAVAEPVKVESPAAVVDVIPAGTEASMAAPIKKSPKKQQFVKQQPAKTPPKPRAPRKPATK